MHGQLVWSQGTDWTSDWYLNCVCVGDGEGWEGKSYRTEPLSCRIWHSLQVDSVRTALSTGHSASVTELLVLGENPSHIWCQKCEGVSSMRGTTNTGGKLGFPLRTCVFMGFITYIELKYITIMVEGRRRSTPL